MTLSLKILSGLYLGNEGVGSCYLVRTLVRGCRCATSWCDLDLTFDLAIMTLTYKILGYILETLRCRKLIRGRDIDQGL